MERKVSLYKYSVLLSKAFLALAGANLLILANHVNKEETINTNGILLRVIAVLRFVRHGVVFQMSG